MKNNIKKEREYSFGTFVKEITMKTAKTSSLSKIEYKRV